MKEITYFTILQQIVLNNRVIFYKKQDYILLLFMNS